jgi:hypothetical protein
MTFRWKADGLDFAGLQPRIGPSSLSLAGLLRHLALARGAVGPGCVGRRPGLGVADDEGGQASLRRLLCDLLEEYGRHTGQADLLREAASGRPQLHHPASSPPIRMMNPVTTTMKNTRTNRAPRDTAVRTPR